MPILPGNTNIYRVTRQGHYDLRIDMEDFEGNSRYALYKDFVIGPESDYFRLSIGAYSGNAGTLCVFCLLSCLFVDVLLLFVCLFVCLFVVVVLK